MKKRINIYGILGYSLLGGLWSCLLDFDHIWLYTNVPNPLSISTEYGGRPFHTIGCFFLFSVVSASVVRFHVILRKKIKQKKQLECQQQNGN